MRPYLKEVHEIVDGRKLCSNCKKLLSLDCFYKNCRVKCGYFGACKDCSRARNREQYKADPDSRGRPSRTPGKVRRKFSSTAPRNQETSLVCGGCGLDLPITSFYPGRRRCKKCLAPELKQYRQASKARYPEEIKKRNRGYALKQYGITEEEYSRIFSVQHGVCAICKQGTPYSLAVDHDHVTGEVRGLLCKPCNVGLGNFKDDRYLLSHAAEYLGRANNSPSNT